jgi:hypothetical protein
VFIQLLADGSSFNAQRENSNQKPENKFARSGNFLIG